MNNIPLNIISSVTDVKDAGKMTRYLVKSGRVPVGRVNLIDKPNGVYVSFIENFNPKYFKRFGRIADQLEVEHCLKRGLSDFEITSEASLNSHAYHYRRGKRFGKITDLSLISKLKSMFNTIDVNKIVDFIIKTTPEGKEFNTAFLGKIPMYMPRALINKYLEIIKHSPLLK